jgi:hypothetical protein
MPYEYSYLYKYAIDLPAGTKSVTLPKNPKIKIASMTVAAEPRDNIAPLQLLYDDFKDNKPVQLRWKEYVTESMKPAAVQKPLFTDDVDPRMMPRVKQYLKEAGLDTVIVKTLPSGSDLADKKSGSNALAVYYPSGKSSKSIQFSGEKISLQNILDSGTQLKDTLLFDNGEGRILIDLQQPVSLDKINMFFENPAWRSSQSRRGPGQRMFSLWCTDSNPDVTGDPKEKGWKYASLYGGSRLSGSNAISFVFDGSVRARYILLVTEGSWHGSQYLNHVDVFKK